METMKEILKHTDKDSDGHVTADELKNVPSTAQAHLDYWASHYEL